MSTVNIRATGVFNRVSQLGSVIVGVVHLLNPVYKAHVAAEKKELLDTVRSGWVAEPDPAVHDTCPICMRAVTEAVVSPTYNMKRGQKIFQCSRDGTIPLLCLLGVSFEFGVS